MHRSAGEEAVHAGHVGQKGLDFGDAPLIVSWLRRYGPTRFLSADAPRVGQQAALECDLVALLDVLEIEQATFVR